MSGQGEVGLMLAEFLARHGDGVAKVVGAIAAAAKPVAAQIRRGPLTGEKGLDQRANEAFAAACAGAGVKAMMADELSAPKLLDAKGAFLVAIDALDGASLMGANIAFGTVFSILDAPAGEIAEASFLQPGHRQRGAGFVIYGTHTALLFTLGQGTHQAVLDPDKGEFVMTRVGIVIPENVPEFAINASNYRHWQSPVRTYVDDCFEGAEGPRGKNFHMYWMASLVADAYRIFTNGGVFLCPADDRKDYERGRLRLVYEANPIGLLVEQANGAATNGINRILDIEPKALGERVPLIFGSNDKVERIRRYFTSGEFSVEQSPLFGKRGLLRN